jgi:hypothetical protein
MNFLSPAFLLGLPLVAVPVVIHLLSRRQQRRISWGAMRFLVEAATRKRRLWRLTDLLLLLLRTAALLFFIFALARPLLPVTWLGGSVPRDVILVLDQSMSMWRREGGAPLFDLAVSEAGDLLDELTPNDSVRVLLAGESPEWLTPDALPGNQDSLETLRAQMEALTPTLGSADLLACLREAADLEAPPDKGARLILVLTDAQRFGWRMDENSIWTAVRARLNQTRIPTTVSLHFRGGEAKGNLSVAGVEAPQPYGSVNQLLNFTAAIENHGPGSSAATLLAWRIDGQQVAVSTVSPLGPGESTSVSLGHAFSGPGTFAVTCALEAKDALPQDDEGTLLAEVFEKLPILIVENPLSDDPLEQDGSFILTALGAGPGSAQGGWRSVFEPMVVRSDVLATLDLSPFYSVILADVPSLPPEGVGRLEAYVQNGGGLWVALGPRTGPDGFNAQLYRGGAGLSPLKLGTPAGDLNDRERFLSVRPVSDAHPATVLLADFQRLDLDRVRIFRRHQLDPFSGRDVSVLLQGQGGEPVVVERRFGQGRTLVQAIPLGVSWSTLPLCQVYVAMLHEWLWYLSEPNLPKRNLAIGEAVIAPAPDAASSAEILRPDGTVEEVPASATPKGARFSFSATRLPGNYEVRVRDTGTTGSAKFHVQRNPEESDLARLSEAEVERLSMTEGFRLGGGLENVKESPQGVAPRRPLEGWFLMALPFVLLAESALAGWTTQRRNLRVQAVRMEV